MYAGERLDQARGIRDLARRVLELRARHETAGLRRTAHDDVLLGSSRRGGEEDRGENDVNGGAHQLEAHKNSEGRDGTPRRSYAKLLTCPLRTW